VCGSIELRKGWSFLLPSKGRGDLNAGVEIWRGVRDIMFKEYS